MSVSCRRWVGVESCWEVSCGGRWSACFVSIEHDAILPAHISVVRGGAFDNVATLMPRPAWEGKRRLPGLTQWLVPLGVTSRRELA